MSGPARESLEGIFYRNDDEAYKDAWNKLNHRYGQPFVIQRAFRERLAKWPRIQPKDAEGLFSDFLNACQEPMSHVKGLQILNDCEENQKLQVVKKLPDWAASRWNQKVTEALISSQGFPSFQSFTAFPQR